MPSTVGARIRCTTRVYSGNRALAQFGEEFTVLQLAGFGRYIYLTEKGLNHGHYNAGDFELVVQREIVVGDTVFCIDARGTYLRPGVQHRVTGVRPGRLLVNGYWCNASRFSLTAPARPAPAAPKPPSPPSVYPFYRYPGCCGAQVVFFRGSYVNAERLKATHNRFVLPSYIGVLNHNQYTHGSGKVLEEAGWVQVGVSASNSGPSYPLYHYLYIHKRPLNDKVTEKPRAF